jgi:hypothetical protein
VDALATLAAAGFDLAHTFDAQLASRAPGLAILGGPERLGLLVGNTRALWPAFQAALRDPELAADPDPLDRHAERAIASGFAPATRIYFGHRRYDGAFLPLQRLAALTGLGALAPSQLVIHPIYGPWFALRAVVVLDGDPPARAPIPQPCHCTTACTDAFTRARHSHDPRDWLTVRERCALQAWRYSDDQIAYHYSRMLRPASGTA